MKAKRMCGFWAVLLLCSCIGNACATVWFTEPGTVRLHRDPFCSRTSLSTALHAQTLRTEPGQESDQLAEHTLCTVCAGAYPDCEPAAPAQTLYCQPEGGKYLHTNRNCPSVSAAYLPLGSELPATAIESSGLALCPTCFAIQPAVWQNAAQVWNATLEEKAQLLPGVWTLPTENALSPQDAWKAAVAFMEASPALMAHFPNGLYTDAIYHYDTAGDAAFAREHYRVLVTSVLMEPVGMVYVDALTGEVLGMTVIEKSAE